MLFAAAGSKEGSVALYLTDTRLHAKRILWGVLKRLNRVQELGGVPNEAELAIALPNGSHIYLGGIHHKDEIEKWRGLPLSVVVIDEAQKTTVYLEELVNDVLGPALMDFDGQIVMAGTPAPVPAGYFYDCVQNPAWEHHEWTAFDNPWLPRKSGKPVLTLLEEECASRGVTVDDPSIQREWFGRWVYDPNSLVFRYEAQRNHYDVLPSLPAGDWECVIAGDIGWDDADALCVLRWNTTRPDLYLAEESILSKQTITQLGERLTQMVNAHNPLGVVLDFGGLGKKIAQELTQRWGLNVQAAEKERKLEHIELLNDALRTGVFHASKASRFAADCMLVEWDKTNPEKPKISDRYHSDICDAVLYGYRRAKQWLSVPEPPPPLRPGSEAWLEKRAAQVQRDVEAQMQAELDEQTRTWRERQDAEEEMELM